MTKQAFAGLMAKAAHVRRSQDRLASLQKLAAPLPGPRSLVRPGNENGRKPPRMTVQAVKPQGPFLQALHPLNPTVAEAVQAHNHAVQPLQQAQPASNPVDTIRRNANGQPIKR